MSSTAVAKVNFVPASSRVRRRRCRFIGGWLNLTEFASWLEPLDDDRHKAYCSLCGKVFSVAHGGLHDVRAHWRGKRHIGFEAAIASDDCHRRDPIDGGNRAVGDDLAEEWDRRFLASGEKLLNGKITMEVSRNYRSSLKYHRDVGKTPAERRIRLEVQQENELPVRPRHLDRQAIAGEEEAEEEEKRSQNVVNSFWPSEDLEELVEAEDVREIDEFEDSDKFEFENQLDNCSRQQFDYDTVEYLGPGDEETEGSDREEGTERVKFAVKNEDRREITDEVVVLKGPRMLREQRKVSGTAATGAHTPTMSNMFPQQYCLRWKYHHSNLQTMFSQLLERQAYCDVTLACEGQTLRAHKVVLSACSTYFDTILSQYEEKDPIVIMRDVKFSDIKVLVEFMYKGEINIDHTRLSSLLKTAEDLHIKGLAEVSWRSDSGQNDLSNSGHSPGAAAPGVETVLREGDVDEPPPPKQRRRGRPPLDDPPSAHDVFTPKVTCFTGNVRTFPEEMMSEGDHESCDDEMMAENNEAPLPVLSYLSKDDSASDQEKKAPTTPSNSNATNPAIPEQFRDVVKMNDYLTTGRRQEFWEEPFTRRVMDAIKSKELEMKSAAEILGVSYGTLYGRYRDSYGCLKHPYRVRDFWSEPGPAEVLAKLRRKEITLFRAAEFLNVTVHTLATYLSTLQGPDRISLAGELSGATSAMDGNNDMENNETVNEILQKLNANAATAATPTTSATIKREGGGYIELPAMVPKAAASVLENNPDITIVKTESVLQQQQRKREYAKVTNTENNNAKLMSGGAVSEITQQQLKLSDTLSLNNDNSKP